MTGQGPHEKPLCLRCMEQGGHQVRNPNKGWPPALSITHTQPEGVGREEGGEETQSGIDEKMIMQTRTDTKRHTLFEHAHRAVL